MNAVAAPPLYACVDAVSITDAAGYVIRGHRRNLLPGAYASNPGDHPIVGALANDIYAQFYARLRPSRHQGARGLRVPFVARLSAANRSKRGWEAGWTLRGEVDGQFALERDGLELYVSASEMFPEPRTAAAGAVYHVDVGKELFNIVSGWYFALGEYPDDLDNAAVLSRIYLNIASEEAVRLIELCTTEWNRREIPFRLKVPDDPTAFGRTDAAVVYIRKPHYQRHERLILGLLATMRTRPGVPAFTKQIGPGIAVAEDPGGNASFGLSRCRLVARGLWRAFLGQAQSTGERIQFVVDEFRRAELDHARPYLSARSEDIYGMAAHGV